MTRWPLEMDAPRTGLKQTGLKKRAGGFVRTLRAFFCLCLLLPVYAVPEGEQRRAPGTGMDAPPPPVLEASSRLGVFGGFERRLFAGWPAERHAWAAGQVWRRFVLPRPAWPTPQRTSLAELQQWRLEGG